MYLTTEALRPDGQAATDRHSTACGLRPSAIKGPHAAVSVGNTNGMGRRGHHISRTGLRDGTPPPRLITRPPLVAAALHVDRAH